MSNQQAHSPETQKAARLVEYLLRLATLRTKLIRETADYEKVLWVSSVPHERGCFTQAWGRDEEHEPDEWLEVHNRREPELPAVPAQCKDGQIRGQIFIIDNSVKMKDLTPSFSFGVKMKDLTPSFDFDP